MFSEEVPGSILRGAACTCERDPAREHKQKSSDEGKEQHALRYLFRQALIFSANFGQRELALYTYPP
jgi:hypothetical protein